MKIKGNYAYAVLHSYRTDGTPTAVELAIKLSKEPMNVDEAQDYVTACVITSGQPDLLDLFINQTEEA